MPPTDRLARHCHMLLSRHDRRLAVTTHVRDEKIEKEGRKITTKYKIKLTVGGEVEEKKGKKYKPTIE